jgi:sterol desaturase/sphingolipid hydroxylase (fatty acid hydroxylase superfamily)
MAASQTVGYEFLITDRQVQSWLSAVSPWPVPAAYATGMRLSIVTTLVTVVFELISLASVIGMLRTKPGLYARAWTSSLFNIMIMGPFVGLVAFGFLCGPDLEPLARMRASLGLLAIHSVGYYAAHRLMHTKAMYWAHSFHHKFNAHVVPTSASAVSFTEYAVAYMLPFIVGCLLIRPDVHALYSVASLISLANILIHTPPLEDAAAALIPSVFVGTDRHIEHHRNLTKNYGASVVNTDWFIAASPTLTRAADAFFLSVGGKPVAVSGSSARTKDM